MKTLWSISTWSILLLASTSFAIESEQITYYHNDALGSPIAATDSDGNLVWREEYSPFGSRLLRESRETDCGSGQCVPVESIWDEKQWYTGKMEETRIGLQYFGARWYEPETGRFLSADPLSFREENAFSFNRYAYANNNPYSYIDPDGNDSISITGTIHVPGSILYAVGINEVPVSGFTAGIAFSFPGFWGGEFDFGVVGGVDIPMVDVGLGKASIDLGYNKGSLKDLGGDSVDTSVTFGNYNAGISWDPETADITGGKAGIGISLGRMSKSLKKVSGKIKNPNTRSLVDTFLDNNLSATYQRSQSKSLISEPTGTPSQNIRPKKENH